MAIFGSSLGCKNPNLGLISMGSESWNSLPLGVPDNSLLEPNAHPGIYNTTVIQARHCDIEPEFRSYDFTVIENAKTYIQAYNTANPSKPLVGKIRIFFGASTSPAVLAKLGSVMLYASNVTVQSTPNIAYPLFWEASWVTHMTALQNALAAKYDNDPLIGQIAVSTFASETAEPFVLPTGCSFNIDLLLNAGFTNDAFQSNLNTIPTVHAAWKHTPLDLTLNPLEEVGDPAAGESCNVAIALGSAMRAAFPHCTLANHGLDSPIKAVAAPLLNWLKTVGGQICYQTDAPSDNIPDAFAVGLTYGMTSFEMWNTKACKGIVNMSQSQLSGFSAQLANT